MADGRQLRGSGQASRGLNLLKLGVVAVVGGIALQVARQEHARPDGRVSVYVALTVFATYSRTQVIRPQIVSVAPFSSRCSTR